MPPEVSARLGQYVAADPQAHPDLAGQRLLITQVIGEGDDCMYAVRNDSGLVTGLGGRLTRYIRANEALPANAPAGARPRVVEMEKPMQQSLVDDVLHLASRYNEMGDRWAVAADKASKVLLTTEEKQKTYRGLIPAVVSLSSQATENEVRAAVQRLADERGCTFDEACQMIICTAKADRFAERVLKLRAAGHDATTALNLAQREDPEGAAAWREAGLN